MYLIVGLGNPEPDYSRTRHNMGFDVINKLSKKHEIALTKTKFNAIYGSGIIENEKVMLVKPQTFMNLSGEAIKEYVNFFKIPIENVFVIYDDMDTEIGKLRIRAQGGPGSHNGMKSVVQELGNNNFPRIRIGIGRPSLEEEESDIINYVIGYIPEEEYLKLQNVQDKAVDAILYYIKHGIDNTMNQFNERSND